MWALKPSSPSISTARIQGPPYIVFDEHEMGHCHRTEAEAIAAAVHEHKTSSHSGYPAEAVRRMMEGRCARRYPNQGVMRFDRCREDGEILHPYTGQKEGVWTVELYLPFQNTYDTMSESDLIALSRASLRTFELGLTG